MKIQIRVHTINGTTYSSDVHEVAPEQLEKIRKAVREDSFNSIRFPINSAAETIIRASQVESVTIRTLEEDSHA